MDDIRFSITLNGRAHSKLIEKAKEFKLTQGEIIELLIEKMGDSFDPKFAVMRESKVSARVAIKKLSKLSPDRLTKLIEASE